MQNAELLIVKAADTYRPSYHSTLKRYVACVCSTFEKMNINKVKVETCLGLVR
jgi:hypothetical protein